jgi:hypothetical protein
LALTRRCAAARAAPLHRCSLKNTDFFGKSDPVLYVAIRSGGSAEPWRELGHTVRCGTAACV